MLTFVIIVPIFMLGTYWCLKRLNKVYNLLALCKRLQTVDGSKLSDKVYLVPGRTVFGNNFDVLGSSPEETFYWYRDLNRRANGKPYVLQFCVGCFYSITRPEDVPEVFKSKTLRTKGYVYKMLRPLLGDGLLLKSGELWHSRRKLLTPAFHFNILQNFNEIFKKESLKLVKSLQAQNEQIVNLNDVMPEFTLNSAFESALGVPLDDIPGSKEYRHTAHNLEMMIVKRLNNPVLCLEWAFYLFDDYKGFYRDVKMAHDFSNTIIKKKREEFHSRQSANEANDDTGKRKHYAMLDMLFYAESNGVIDHQGICDEVDTFIFEGFETTSTCLIFTLLNLALDQDIQEKCYREVENCDLPNLSIFDFNQLQYLERVIKETLRLYPSAPNISRSSTESTKLNGVIIPAGAEINIHIYDIMRDARHFPDPLKFDPDRFLPENSIGRHPFAFMPFSAGSRNCIGQKFAMLEIKAILVGILQNFRLLPETTLEEIRYENRLVLGTKENILVRMIKRSS